MSISVVLGVGYGDEGKGLMVDYLTRRKSRPIGSTMVIRFSGGQQAGHTVVTDTDRHIFSNYGSGSLAGAASYFSEHCTFYPPNLLRERKALLNIPGTNTSLTIHPLCNLTTHYDVAYNRWLESNRKKTNSHHGSCGLGINSTIERNTTSPHKIFAVDLLYHYLFIEKMTSIWEYYHKKICGNDLRSPSRRFNEFTEIAKDLEIDFMIACGKVIDDEVINIKGYEAITNADSVIFEGSQGIMLDQDHGLFPNVTRSHTTSRNVTDILNKLNVSERRVDTYYMTRCYQTRHGKGWMTGEGGTVNMAFQDDTNIHNEWQGTLRFSELDYDAINYAINVDKAYKAYEGDSHIVFTHMDQRPDFKIDVTKIPIMTVLTSHGPRASDISQSKVKDFTTWSKRSKSSSHRSI